MTFIIKTKIFADNNSRSNLIKSKILKLIKTNKIKRMNIIIVVGGDGFMLKILKKLYML